VTMIGLSWGGDVDFDDIGGGDEDPVVEEGRIQNGDEYLMCFEREQRKRPLILSIQSLPVLEYKYPDLITLFSLSSSPSSSSSTHHKLSTSPTYKMPDHFYTTVTSGELAPSSGYVSEGIAAYVDSTQQPRVTAVYRWFSPQSGDHFYTTDPSGELAPKSGYKSEGVAFWVCTSPFLSFPLPQKKHIETDKEKRQDCSRRIRPLFPVV